MQYTIASPAPEKKSIVQADRLYGHRKEDNRYHRRSHLSLWPHHERSIQ